jgi:4-hydroxy-tetrahydrodipicolinate reductase
MGAEVCKAVEADDELDLVARVERGDDLEALESGGAEVAVDFTTPDAVLGNVRWCLEHGIHAVIGTTGISEADLADIATWTKAGRANAFVAPNFALGAVLMMMFAAQASPFFESAEIVERHHARKLDAPSGTARRTAELMNAARSSEWSTPSGEGAATSRGEDLDGIRVHSLRVAGSVAHQEVVLGSPGETLTIKHDSLDRTSFMPGVLLAVKRVSSLGGVTVGLEHLLDL